MKTISFSRILAASTLAFLSASIQLTAGPGDGMVVGATKIVDHGPNNQRYNIVLLAEGYRQADQAQFAQDAQHFVDVFFQTPPFNTNCSAFNIWRVDITSTDAGADDPAVCADGSTGSGAMVSTYFDSTFCGGGNIRRLLTANNGTAMSVLNAQVPDWDMGVVVVNSTIYGGSGGQIAVTSISGSDWPQIAIHEFGHAAFALGDEYEYFAGCGAGGDAAGTHDHHPNVEPAAANLTVQTNPTMVKWRDLFFSGIAIPTTQNADCTQCDPQANPFGQTRVGLYEGADYFHCGAYRPVFNCKFRTLASDFCPVCIRRMLQVLQPFSPANGTPTCNPGGPYVVECSGASTQVVLDGRLSSDPDCNALTFTWTGPFAGGTAAGATAAVQFAGTGTFPVNLRVSDGIASSMCSVNVMVRDTHPPTIFCPPDITQPTDPGRCDAQVSFVATAVDVCDSTPTVSCVPPSGSVFPKGGTTVHCTATDDSGNMSLCSFGVTVVDNEPPMITCPGDRTIEFTSKAGAPDNYPPPAVTDNCPGATAVCVPPAGSTFPIGMTTVICTATDTSGNSTPCNFTIVVLGALGVKSNVYNELSALRATVIDKHDGKDLDQALTKLGNSLDPTLWVDQTHVEPKHGDKAFDEEKETVQKLQKLIRENRSLIPAGVLEGFIARIVKSDRLLAEIAIMDAMMLALPAEMISKAQEELARGDEDAADGQYEQAILRYREAWKRVNPLRIVLAKVVNAQPRWEMIGTPGTTYTIQASTNLVQWVDIATVKAAADGLLTFSDPSPAANYRGRWYRVSSP